MNGLAKFFLFLPRSVALNIGVFFGILSYYLFKKRRKLALDNLNKALGNQFSPTEQIKIIKKVFINLSLNFVEFFRFAEITPETLSQFVTFHGLDYLDQAYRQHNGVLVLTGHIGNWELLAASLGLLGYKGGILVKHAHQKFFDDFLKQQRESKNLKLFYGKDSVRDILKSIKAGEVIGIIIDQHGIGRDSVTVPFFGRPAATLKGLAVLSERTRAPVIPAYIYRDENFHHHIVISPPIEHRDNTSEDRTLQYTEWLESVVRKHPDQWMWTHNRWKK